MPKADIRREHTVARAPIGEISGSLRVVVVVTGKILVIRYVLFAVLFSVFVG
jgi:hypothetical protein